jgi:pyruvate formate lyase activating enzyme
MRCYNISNEEYLQPLSHCTLCEHRCGVNRLEGQTGICRMTMPGVASATLHPAPPESYTIFKRDVPQIQT